MTNRYLVYLSLHRYIIQTFLSEIPRLDRAPTKIAYYSETECHDINKSRIHLSASANTCSTHSVRSSIPGQTKDISPYMINSITTRPSQWRSQDGAPALLYDQFNHNFFWKNSFGIRYGVWNCTIYTFKKNFYGRVDFSTKKIYFFPRFQDFHCPPACLLMCWQVSIPPLGFWDEKCEDLANPIQNQQK